MRRWIIRTLVGCIISIIVGAVPTFALLAFIGDVKWTANSNLALAIAWLIVAVPVYGLCVGYIQWEQQLFDVLPRKSWTITSTLSGALATIIFFIIIEYGPAPDSDLINDKRTLYDTWFSAIFIWSVVTGIGFGLPFWFLFKRNDYPSNQVLVISITATLTAFMLTMLLDGLGTWHYFSSPYDLCFTTPFFVGGAIGFAVRNILKQKRTLQ